MILHTKGIDGGTPTSGISSEAGETHPHALLFTSYNGAKYLFDSATSTIHPWPWRISSVDLDRLYEIGNDHLLAYVDQVGATPDLARYVVLWRTKAGAFGRPLRHTHGELCALESGVVKAEPADRENPHFERVAPMLGEAHGGSLVKEPPPIQLALPSMLANLILVVTDACNLRCKYCLLGGTYEGFKPLRSKHMSWEIARRAVDHFLALNDSPTFQAMNDRKINISFFGGEPLLRGDLIRKVVEYSKALEKRDSYWIDYAVTTNLTYLPRDLATYLIDRDIALQVSIDGPAEIHDRYRADTRGCGSFSIMRGNLEKLRDMNSDYFARRVRSAVTLNGNSNLLAINKFFESGDPVIPPVGVVSLLRDFANSEFHRVYPYDPARMWGQYVELMNDYRRRKRDGIPILKDSFLYHLFEEALLVLYSRIMHLGTPTRPAYTGTCQPGRRFAVSTDGKFHVCERINELFPIGDVETGVDFDRCSEMLRHYYVSLPDCDRCWARPICGTCMAHNCQNDQFVFESYCNEIRTDLAHRLRFLCTVLEDRPDALSLQDPLIDRTHMLEVSP